MSPRSSRRRFAPAIAALAAVALGACSGGGSKHAGSSTSASRPSTTTAGVKLQLQPIVVANAGAKQAALDDATRDKALAAVDGYVQRGIVGPLADGARVGDVAPVFDAKTLAQATGPDAATLFDTGFPKVANLRAKTAAVTLTDLADENGAPVIIGAALVLDLAGTANGKPVRIHRLADLALAPDNGTWKITGYDVAVQRDGAGVPHPSTSAATSTTGGTP